DGKIVIDAPARVDLELKDITPDVDHPESSRGVARLGLAAGGLEARIDASKQNDAVDFEVTAKAATISGARRLVTDDLAQRVPWDKMALELHAKGRVEHLVGA